MMTMRIMKIDGDDDDNAGGYDSENYDQEQRKTFSQFLKELARRATKFRRLALWNIGAQGRPQE